MKTTIQLATTALRAIRTHLPSMVRAIGANEVEQLWRVGDTMAYSARVNGRLIALIVTPGLAGGYDIKVNTDRVPDISNEYNSAIKRRELKATLESSEYKNAHFDMKIRYFLKHGRI